MGLMSQIKWEGEKEKKKNKKNKNKNVIWRRKSKKNNNKKRKKLQKAQKRKKKEKKKKKKKKVLKKWCLPLFKGTHYGIYVFLPTESGYHLWISHSELAFPIGQDL